MGATRATRCVLPAAAALAVAWAAGCSERTPVGDESVVSREPWTGSWYAECSELDCAQSCSSDGRTMRGECSWTGEALECRCIGRPAASCEAEPCASSCASRGYNGSLCDRVGCLCFHVRAADADADAVEETDADAVDESDIDVAEAADADVAEGPDLDVVGEADVDFAEGMTG